MSFYIKIVGTFPWIVTPASLRDTISKQIHLASPQNLRKHLHKTISFSL